MSSRKHTNNGVYIAVVTVLKFSYKNGGDVLRNCVSFKRTFKNNLYSNQHRLRNDNFSRQMQLHQTEVSQIKH